MITKLVVPSSRLTNDVVDKNNIVMSGLALVITPGSLHASGEVLYYSNGVLWELERNLAPSDYANYLGRAIKSYAERNGLSLPLNEEKAVEALDDTVVAWKIKSLGDSDVIIHMRKSDLILPRGLEDELHQLEAQRLVTYLIRTPAIGLGSLTLAIDEDNVPMLVRNGAPLERAPRKRKQKHVSKSNNSK
jgi:hypothetical protein